LLEKLGGDGVFVDGVVAGDYGEAVGGDEVVFLVFIGVVADDGAVGDVDVAIDDGVADAAVAADVDVREDYGGVDVGVGVDADILGENGVANDGSGDDGAGADDGVDGHAGAARLAEDELGGRVLVGARAHGPGFVVEVEGGGDAGDVHVGFVVGLQGADVAPVERFLLVFVDEVVGVHLVAAEETRQDVVAEVVFGVRVFGVLDEFGQEDVGVEEIDTHGDIDHVGVEGGADFGLLGFFFEADDLAGAAYFDDTEGGDLGGRDGQSGDGDVGVGVDVALHHESVVHLVNVVAGEDEDILWFFGADGVDVLVDGIGSALVPGLGDALHRREDLDEFAELVGDDRAPALPDMAVEGERFVLGEDVDVAEVGVDAVGESDVDDAVLAGEGYGRLGAIAGEWEEAVAGTTGKQDAKRISHRSNTPALRFGKKN